MLSAQLAGGYKPDAKVYLEALRLLECEAGDAGMVAAHPSDLRAAAAIGLRPVFIRLPRSGDPARGRPSRPRWTGCWPPTAWWTWPTYSAADGLPGSAGGLSAGGAGGRGR